MGMNKTKNHKLLMYCNLISVNENHF